jgi:hypothetical protein
MPVPFADIVGLKHVPTVQRRKAAIASTERCRKAKIASKEKRRKATIASKKYRDNNK